MTAFDRCYGCVAEVHLGWATSQFWGQRDEHGTRGEMRRNLADWDHAVTCKSSGEKILGQGSMELGLYPVTQYEGTPLCAAHAGLHFERQIRR